MVMPSPLRERSYGGEYMAEGEAAERICIEYLRSRDDVETVTDLRHIRLMQSVDVDCACTLTDGRVVMVEIKSDVHMVGAAGNVLFELLRLNHTAEPEHAVKLGWTARTKADWLLYYSPKQHAVYQTETRALQQAFQKYSAKARGSMRLSVVPTDNIKTTLVALIPWDACAGCFECHTL